MILRLCPEGQILIDGDLNVSRNDDTLHSSESHIITVASTDSSHDNIVPILKIKSFYHLFLLNFCQECTCKNFLSPPPFICTGLDPLQEISNMEPKDEGS